MTSQRRDIDYRIGERKQASKGQKQGFFFTVIGKKKYNNYR